MKDADNNRVGAFLNKWLGSEGNERANYQTFFGELCVALAVPAPPPLNYRNHHRTPRHPNAECVA